MAVDVKPQDILQWIRTRLTDHVGLPAACVLVSTDDASPLTLPRGSHFVVLAPGRFTFHPAEQSGQHLETEWVIGIGVYVRLPVDRPGEIDNILLGEDGLYHLVHKILQSLTGAYPEGWNVRSTGTSTGVSQIQWAAAADQPLSYLFTRVDVTVSFEWALT